MPRKEKFSLKGFYDDEIFIQKDFCSDKRKVLSRYPYHVHLNSLKNYDKIFSQPIKIFSIMQQLLQLVICDSDTLESFIFDKKRFLIEAIKHKSYSDLFRFIFKIIFFVSTQKCIESLFDEDSKTFNSEKIMDNYREIRKLGYFGVNKPRYTMMFCGAIYCYYFDQTFAKKLSSYYVLEDFSTIDIGDDYGDVYNIAKYALHQKYPKIKYWDGNTDYDENDYPICFEKFVYYRCNSEKMTFVLENMKEDDENFIIACFLKEYFETEHQKIIKKMKTSPQHLHLPKVFLEKVLLELYCFYRFPFEMPKE